ncbi:MAG: hypothetical protein JW840_07880 [Candidatus Thermoplasmatota archaeon]|nr:hypothetical protein [Candidatus Thermoplasmatota archaeon]
MKEKRATGNQYHLKPKSFEYGKPDSYGNRRVWIPPERKCRCFHCGFPWENTNYNHKKHALDFSGLVCPNCGSKNIVHHEYSDGDVKGG